MNTYELIALAAVLRIFSAFRDGWSARLVKWIPWHVVGWVYRDGIIIWITWKLLGAPWASFNRFSDWIIVAGVNIVLHRAFYWLGEYTVRFFPNWLAFVHGKTEPTKETMRWAMQEIEKYEQMKSDQ